MFTNIDLISFVAGVLELFNGFSVISFLELFYIVIYFIFYRITRRKKVNRRKAWMEKKSLKINQIFRGNPLNFLRNCSMKEIQAKIIFVFSCGMSFMLCIVLMIEVKRKIPESRVIAVEDYWKVTENVSLSISYDIN